MLLDTHCLLWVLDGGGGLGPDARRSIERAAEVRYSAISIAEIRIKQMLGKLSVPDDLLQRIELSGLRAAAYDVEAADALLRWPALVRHDPFDRMLLAQAVAASTVLLTADRVLLGLPQAPVVDGRC